MKRKKVVLGLSGGVDSSVSLYLLKKKGYDVVCVYMKNWDSTLNYDLKGNPTINDEICPQEKDFLDAQKVCKQLNTKLIKVDFIKEYWDRVFTYFLDEYKKNRTPNPDILCNNEIKFKAFLDYANKLNCDYIAMGHYAKTKKIKGVKCLLKAKDKSKDQTYFLSQLTNKQLEKAIFPLGNIQKKKVRKIAKKLNLETKDKKDSTGICFIGERKFSKFLSNYLPAKPGNIIRLSGKVIGRHNGLINYTIGQRKGIGLGTLDNQKGPWYVCGKDLKTNNLIVENKDNLEYMYSDNCIVDSCIFRHPIKENKVYGAKFRYRQNDQKVKIKILSKNKIHVYYNSQRAVTPGQAFVLYDKKICIGGGFIDKVYKGESERKYS